MLKEIIMLMQLFRIMRVFSCEMEHNEIPALLKPSCGGSAPSEEKDL